MTIPARIGTYTHTGQVRSIHLHHGGPQAARLLADYWNTTNRVNLLIDGGDLLRLDEPQRYDGRITTIIGITRSVPHNEPIEHADNDWPLSAARCLYLYNDGIWWARQMKTDGAWPDNWTPIDNEDA